MLNDYFDPICLVILLLIGTVIWHGPKLLRDTSERSWRTVIPLKVEINPIRHLLGLVGAHHFVDVSRLRVKDIAYPTRCELIP